MSRKEICQVFLKVQEQEGGDGAVENSVTSTGLTPSGLKTGPFWH